MRTLARLFLVSMLLGTGAVAVSQSAQAGSGVDGYNQCFGNGCGGNGPW